MDGQWKLNHTKIVVHTEQAYIDQDPWEVANEYFRKFHSASKITWRRAESILRATRTSYIVHRRRGNFTLDVCFQKDYDLGAGRPQKLRKTPNQVRVLRKCMVQF